MVSCQLSRLIEKSKVIKRFKSFKLGFCNCGCGKEIPIRNKKKLLQRYQHGHHNRGKSGPKNPNWRGGFKIVGGYIQVFEPLNPNKFSGGYVFEHVKVMSEYLGRPLKKGEVVHHINEIKTDNRMENLKLLSNSEHVRLHTIGNNNRKKDLSNRICLDCNSTITYIDKRGWHKWYEYGSGHICIKCYTIRRRSKNL